MRLLTAGSSVRARQEEPKGKAVWTIVHAAFPFCFLYLLSQPTLCFGRRIAAVCTTLAWCAAEVVCRHCAQHSEASLLEEPKEKNYPSGWFFSFCCGKNHQLCWWTKSLELWTKKELPDILESRSANLTKNIEEVFS